MNEGSARRFGEMVSALFTQHGYGAADRPTMEVPSERTQFWMDLLDEETLELKEALKQGDIVGFADGLGDLVYVAYGIARVSGIDLDAVLDEIHRSNLTKDPPQGGKSLKGERYCPPDLARVLGI